MRTPNTAPITVAWNEQGAAWLVRGTQAVACPFRTPMLAKPTLAGEMPGQMPHLCSSDCALFQVHKASGKALFDSDYVIQGCAQDSDIIRFNPEPFKPANEPTGPIIKKP